LPDNGARMLAPAASRSHSIVPAKRRVCARKIQLWANKITCLWRIIISGSRHKALLHQSLLTSATNTRIALVLYLINVGDVFNHSSLFYIIFTFLIYHDIIIHIFFLLILICLCFALCHGTNSWYLPVYSLFLNSSAIIVFLQSRMVLCLYPATFRHNVPKCASFFFLSIAQALKAYASKSNAHANYALLFSLFLFLKYITECSASLVFRDNASKIYMYIYIHIYVCT